MPMPGMSWTNVTCATPDCNRTFECFLPKEHDAYSFLCPRCFLSTTGNRDHLMIGAFYGIPPRRQHLIRECVRLLAVGKDQHASSTAHECLECALLNAAFTAAGSWRNVYIDTAEALASEHGTSLGRVELMLNAISKGQSRVFTGR